MGEEKLFLSDLIRDSFAYDLEQIKDHRQQIDEIEKQIQETNALIRKVSLQQDVNDLTDIIVIQEELRSKGIELEVYINKDNQYLFKLNGKDNDVRCDSIQILKQCIQSILVGLNVKK